MAKNLVAQILELAISLFNQKQAQAPVAVATPAPVVPDKAPDATVDWSKPSSHISNYFKVMDAIWLPTWKRVAEEKDGLDATIKANSERLFKAMDVVREHFGKPIRVHVSYRPVEYNKLIGGSLKSAHSEGLACDFDVVGMTCDDVRKELSANDNKLLEEWKMRCEDLPGSNWVHLDLRDLAPGGRRFFKP